VMGADMQGEQTAPAVAAVPANLRLNLGCCDTLLPGFVNVDLVAAPGVEAADLREPWPWADSSVALVRAYDIIEHLPDKIHTLNELWRVLAPGGTAEIAVPTTDGSGAFQDPTHVSFWNRRSFLYYEAGNPYRERFARFYGIQAKFRTVAERMDRTVDGPRLTITLRAVKP
jgi:SAM-dependent methyltransferase